MQSGTRHNTTLSHSNTNIRDEILSFLKEIKTDYADFGLSKIGLIGSYAYDMQRDDSDIDIIFDTTDELNEKIESGEVYGGEYLDMMADIKERVSLKFNKPVDLIDEGGLEDFRRSRFTQRAIYV